MISIFHQHVGGIKFKEPSLTPKEVFNAFNINQFDIFAGSGINIDTNKS